MSEKIPANARAYMKGVKANRQKQKQKQSNKQSQVVIINQESKRRRAPNKPKSAPASGGGGGGPSYIPYVLPQTQLTAASYQNSAVQPLNEIQQLTQALNPFQATPVYQNPFRVQGIRSLNQPKLYQVEQPLEQPAPSPPPPDLPNNVEEQNFVEQRARPLPMLPIGSSSSAYQGFSQNQSVNDLARQVDREVNAYEDFGGDDAQADFQRRRQDHMSMGPEDEEHTEFLRLTSNLKPGDQIADLIGNIRDKYSKK